MQHASGAAHERERATMSREIRERSATLDVRETQPPFELARFGGARYFIGGSAAVLPWHGDVCVSSYDARWLDWHGRQCTRFDADAVKRDNRRGRIPEE
jgi:hypothetical protein